MFTCVPSNEEIAQMLEQVAELLEFKEENQYRITSYRNAANTIRSINNCVSKVLQEEGILAVQKYSGIGEKLSKAMMEIVRTGRLALLEKLKEEFMSEKLLAEVPGIGKELANRIHSELGINTLEELELATYDGRLNKIEGLGEKRIKGIRTALSGMLSQSSFRKSRQRAKDVDIEEREEPSVDELLEIDAEYRRKANAGELPIITPKRFNPEGKKWLPILHTNRNGLLYTVLFSNTAKAHELGMTNDWVVIYYEYGGGEEHQCTVITATGGPFKDRRIIRGREKECYKYYMKNDEKRISDSTLNIPF